MSSYQLLTDGLALLSGALICNSIPHLACGLRGEPFPTPFARWSGGGNSAPVFNFIWGSVNFNIGFTMMLKRVFKVGFSFEHLLFICGFVVFGILLSLHFTRVRAHAGA